MTTLIKTAVFYFDPGSPFVPAIYETTCTGVPDTPKASPQVPAAGIKSGEPGGPPYYVITTDANNAHVAVPYCNSGMVDVVTGKCL